jgi:hypothetical protein
MFFLMTEKGGISFKVMFILFALFSLIHIGIKLVPVYLDAEQMKDEMASKAGFAQTLKDEEILMDLVRKAKNLNLPLDKDDFKLVRDDAKRRMKIQTTWDAEVTFFFDIYPPYTTRIIHFDPVIEEDYSRKF